MAGERGQPAAPARPNWPSGVHRPGPGTISAGRPAVGLNTNRRPEGLGVLGEPRADARPWVRGGSGPPNQLVARASLIPLAGSGCSHPPAVPAHAPNPTSPLPRGRASPRCSEGRVQLQRARIISHLAGSGTRGSNDTEQDAEGPQILVQRATACWSHCCSIFTNSSTYVRAGSGTPRGPRGDV